MSRRWLLFFLALVLIATGAVLYLRKQMLEDFRAAVEPWLDKGPLAERVEVGGYDVSLLRRAGIIKDVRLKDPVLVDNPFVRFEFLGIERIVITGFKEDPELGIPLETRILGDDLRFSMLFKETGRRVTITADSLSDFAFDPEKDLLNGHFALTSPRGDLDLRVQIAEIKDYLLLLKERPPEEIPNAVFFSRLMKIVPRGLSFRYEDRGLLRTIFYAACPDDCDRRLEEAVREIERELSGPPALETVKEALVKILRQGRGGIEISVVNKEDLALKDLFFVFLGLALEESAQRDASKGVLEKLSPYFAFQIKAL